jgi:hypothetical protein
MAERYTLTEADVDGCRKILARLEELDALTGGYRVGSVQGHTGSATATVHYASRPGPQVTAEAISHALESVATLGQLCKKVIAHYETNMVHGWGECAGCGWVWPLTADGTVREHDTADGGCFGAGEYPRREVNHG